LIGSTITDYSHYIWLPVILLTVNIPSVVYFSYWTPPSLKDIYTIRANDATVVLNVVDGEELSVNSRTQTSSALAAENQDYSVDQRV